MSTDRTQISDYDAVDFPSLPFAASHPDRLATQGLLFGMEPADTEHCRVLEIGCGAGGNVLPMAAGLPESQFVAIDLSESQIAQARQVAEAVELTNVTLKAVDLIDLDSNLGTFDYIICHGVYSWTTEAAREKILTLCKEMLAPQGIAYVNYNTYPGWHVQGMVRDMISYHANQFDDPQQRTSQARAMINFLETALGGDQSLYSQLLRTELQACRSYSDGFLFHSQLNVVNHPCYLHDFVRRAERAGLQYLGDADLAQMWAGMLPAESQQALRSISRSTVDFEQHLDFLRNTMSRRSLLCHPDVELDRTLRVASLQNLFVASNLHADAGSPDSAAAVTFRAPDGRSVATANPGFQAAMHYLSQQWPVAVRFDELGHVVAAGASHNGQWQEDLLNCIAAGVVELRQRVPACARHVSETPRATRLARYQAEQGGFIADLRHHARRLDDLDRTLLAHLDGQHDVAALAKRLRQAITSGKLKSTQDATPNSPADDEATVHSALKRLANHALLLHQDMRDMSG